LQSNCGKNKFFLIAWQPIVYNNLSTCRLLEASSNLSVP
jgi:hypothetical protein